MVDLALKRPLTTIVLFLGILLFAILSVLSIPIDIFPKLNSPTIYVIEPYGGMSPQQMEGFFATRLQDQFLRMRTTAQEREIAGHRQLGIGRGIAHGKTPCMNQFGFSASRP